MPAQHPTFSLVAICSSWLTLAVHAVRTVQLPGLTLPSTAAANAQLVKTTFQSAFTDYKTYAWGHDDVTPVSRGFKDTRNGWGATIFDAMTTARIMGLDDIYDEAVSFVGSVDFSKSQTPDHVSFFETTIRYLASMLSAYELNGKQDAVLIQQAKVLGDKLVYAFPVNNPPPSVSTNPIPYGSVDFSTNLADAGDGTGPNNIAAAATNALEFQKLTQYTGNSTYQNLAEKAIKTIAQNKAQFPGLVPQSVFPNGTTTGDDLTWGGGSDSYYEYLIKYARLTNFADSTYANTWLQLVDSSIQVLLKTSTGFGSRQYLSTYQNGAAQYSAEALGCFAGGNWILGGKLLNNDTIVQYGLNLTDACIDGYRSTGTGLGYVPNLSELCFLYDDPRPGNWFFDATDGGGPAFTPAEIPFFFEHGFVINSPDYDLRPEVFESLFYAWRVTGNIKYQDFAVDMVQALLNYAKAPAAFAPLINVTRTDKSLANFNDDTESFFFAETLKYLYLTFDDPNHISLDEWIFNTEAHPLAPLAN